MVIELETSNTEKAQEIDAKAEKLEKRWQDFVARAEKCNFTLSLLSQFYEYCSEVNGDFTLFVVYSFHQIMV